MYALLLKRLATLIPTLLGVTVAAFALIRLIPGDPIEIMVGERRLDPAAHAALMQQLGLDQPLWQQYARYLGQLQGHQEPDRHGRHQEPAGHRPLVLAAQRGQHRRRRLGRPGRRPARPVIHPRRDLQVLLEPGRPSPLHLTGPFAGPFSLR